MFDDSIEQKKSFPKKGKRSVHMIVKDRDLQINIPTIEEHSPHRNANFKMRTIPFSEKLSPTDFQENEIKVAMAEAESTFDSMMQIRKQLRKAYEEFMHSAP